MGRKHKKESGSFHSCIQEIKLSKCSLSFAFNEFKYYSSSSFYLDISQKNKKQKQKYIPYKQLLIKLIPMNGTYFVNNECMKVPKIVTILLGLGRFCSDSKPKWEEGVIMWISHIHW
jgi:hypothetical protein